MPEQPYQLNTERFPDNRTYGIPIAEYERRRDLVGSARACEPIVRFCACGNAGRHPRRGMSGPRLDDLPALA
jgi:hypothetical protein